MPKKVVHSNGFIEFKPTPDELKIQNLENRIISLENSVAELIAQLRDSRKEQ